MKRARVDPALAAATRALDLLVLAERTANRAAKDGTDEANDTFFRAVEAHTEYRAALTELKAALS